MRVVRGIVNAVLMATLIKPIVRLTVTRYRKRAQASPAATFGIPVQELVEAALIEELAPAAVALQVEDLQLAPEEAIEDIAGRSAIRTLLIAGVVVVAIAGAAAAIATLIKRRREARDAEWVAVPVEGSTEEAEEAEEAEIQEALID